MKQLLDARIPYEKYKEWYDNQRVDLICRNYLKVYMNLDTKFFSSLKLSFERLTITNIYEIYNSIFQFPFKLPKEYQTDLDIFLNNFKEF